MMVIRATAGARRPPKRFSARRMIGQVETTIITDQIPAPRKGRITHRLPRARIAVVMIASSVWVRSLAGVVTGHLRRARQSRADLHHLGVAGSSPAIRLERVEEQPAAELRL